MNFNKNIIRATKKGIVAGTAALMLAGTPVASAIMPVTTALAAETEDTNYDTMYMPAATSFDDATIDEFVENINILQKRLDSFRSDDRMVSGEYIACAPIKNGESRITWWKEPSHSQYGDFYATMSIREPFHVDDFYGQAEFLQRVFPTFADVLEDEHAETKWVNSSGKGVMHDFFRYEAKCFENETIFGLKASNTDAVKAKINDLKATGATFTGTDYEKAKAAFDWTIKNTTYNKLGDSKTFASTFYWLCEGAGIDSIMYISEDESRVFNAISLDGQHYLVDTYAAVEATNPSDYFVFLPTDSLHAVKIPMASEAYNPNAKKDDTDAGKTDPTPTPGKDDVTDDTDNGNTSDDNNGGSSDTSDDSDNGGSWSGSSDDDSTESSNVSTSTSTTGGSMQKATTSDGAYTAVANVPVTIASADTGVYAYNDDIKAAVQSVLPGYTVQSYVNITTPAPSGNIQILTPVANLMQNPGLMTGDVTAVKNYYLVYVNNGIIQLLPNTSNSPYMIAAPIFGSGNYAIVMAD